MTKNLLTTKQAAEQLGVSTKTIRRWASQGKIEAVRTSGGHRRYQLKDIAPQTKINLIQMLPYLILTAILSGGIMYFSTKIFYQKQITTIKQQLGTYFNQTGNQEINLIHSTNGKAIDSGIGVIKPEDNDNILVDSKEIQATSEIFLSSPDQDKIKVTQIISGIGFIVSIQEDVTSPIYFNWEISN